MKKADNNFLQSVDVTCMFVVRSKAGMNLSNFWVKFIIFHKD